MIVFYNDRNVLTGKKTIPSNTKNFDMDADIFQIIASIQEIDIFGEPLLFDISLDFSKIKDEVEIIDNLLMKTPHHIWWHSSKKPQIKTSFDWFESSKEIPQYNIFDAVDLLAAKNKKDLWIYYQQHLKDQDIQDIVPSFLWGIKSMILVVTLQTEGMSPFVINKMKKNIPLWDKESLLNIQFALIEIYEGEITGQHAHGMLEQLILSL